MQVKDLRTSILKQLLMLQACFSMLTFINLFSFYFIFLVNFFLFFIVMWHKLIFVTKKVMSSGKLVFAAALCLCHKITYKTSNILLSNIICFRWITYWTRVGMWTSAFPPKSPRQKSNFPTT